MLHMSSYYRIVWMLTVLIPAAPELFVWHSGRRFEYRPSSVYDLQQIYMDFPSSGQLIDMDGACIVAPSELSGSQSAAPAPLPRCEPLPPFDGAIFAARVSNRSLGRCAVVR